MTYNDAFNNFLYENSLELISAKTTIGFEGRHKDSFKDFVTLNATVRLLAQQTKVNSSGTKVSVSYVPFTSTVWSELTKSKKLRNHGTHDDD